MKLHFLRFTLILSLVVGFLPESFSQSSSPYSRLGIGDIKYAYSARALGIGQLEVADAQQNFISIYNPSAFYNLNRTRIEFDLSYHGSFLSADNSSTYYAKADFGGFAFAFPISKRYGIAAAGGIVPFSNVSYNVKSSVGSSIGNYETDYEGKGGLSKLFIGSSYKLPFDLVIGATFDYYFGNIDYTSDITFYDQTNAGAQYTKEYRPKGIGTTLGLLTPDLAAAFGTNDITNFRVGLAFNFISKLRTDTILTSSTTLGTDTISTGIVNMKIPGRLSAGLSFVLNKKYLLSLNYAFEAWTKYSFNDKISANLRNASKISAGFEYTPQKVLGASFWEQIIWRTGLSFEQTQYFVNNKGINQYSVSGGFSLPISTENTLDLGLQYAIRGTADPGLFKENILKLFITVSLGDIWFIREEK